MQVHYSQKINSNTFALAAASTSTKHSDYDAIKMVL